MDVVALAVGASYHSGFCPLPLPGSARLGERHGRNGRPGVSRRVPVCPGVSRREGWHGEARESFCLLVPDCRVPPIRGCPRLCRQSLLCRIGSRGPAPLPLPAHQPALAFCYSYRPSSPFGVRAPAMRPSTKKTVVANMGAVEVAQVAGEASYIGGVAGVMFGITLVGLALGFVLLRVESLAEEGKI